MGAEARDRWLRRQSTSTTQRVCRDLAELVADCEPEFGTLTDAELALLTTEYRSRIAAGEDRIDLLVDAFAAVREAAWRALGLRPHGEQIMAGAAMAMGMIADMPAGEGKTLACVLPAYLASLTGDAVHVVTLDGGQAVRAADQMRPVFERLGMEIGVLDPDLDADALRAVYAAGVVYGAAEEFAFDLLRDDLAWTPAERVQRGLDVAVVDDAVARFLDGFAAAPVIGVPRSAEEIGLRGRWAALADALAGDGGDYSVDPDQGRVRLRQPGIRKLEDLLGVDELRPAPDAEILKLLAQALEARELGGEAPETGAPAQLARITIGGYLLEYETVCGASAGAWHQSEAFDRVYGQEVVRIPPRRPVDDVEPPIHDPDALARRFDTLLALDLQRREMVARRTAIQTAEDPSALIDDMIRDLVEEVFQDLPPRFGVDDVKDALAVVQGACPISCAAERLMRLPGRGAIVRAVLADALEAYRRHGRELGTGTLRDLARRALITATDHAWRDHLARAAALPAALAFLDRWGDDRVADYVAALDESYLLMTETVIVDSIDRAFDQQAGPA